MTFKDWLSERVDDDSPAGFLARLILADKRCLGTTPNYLRRWASKMGHNYKVMLCIDLAQVEFEIYERAKARQQASKVTKLDRIDYVSDNFNVF